MELKLTIVASQFVFSLLVLSSCAESQGKDPFVCQVPKAIKHGRFTVGNRTEIGLGEKLHFECDEGYRRRRSRLRRCGRKDGVARYAGPPPFCKDINECKSSNPCDPDATCTNSPGSFTCTCNPPFIGDGFFCSMYPTTTMPIGCNVDGKFYAPGSEISSGKSRTWCYWTYCGEDGNIIHADDFNCDTTTTATTTEATTMDHPAPPPPPPPVPPGCFYNDKLYRPGSTISEDKCSKKICTDDGQIIVADDKQCLNPEVDTTTTPPPTSPPGCLWNGNFYLPGTTISDDKCSTIVCDKGGSVLIGDKFDCLHPVGSTTTPTPTTRPTLPPGCFWGGKFYPPGAKISEGKCSTVFCGDDGNAFVADEYECLYPSASSSATPSPTTT